MINQENPGGRHPAAPFVKKLRDILLHLEMGLGRDTLPAPPPAEPNQIGASELDLSGDSFTDSFADSALKFQLLQVFLKVLANHPDKQDNVIVIMEKLMENPAALTREEIRFMLSLTEEALFLTDEDDENAVYH